MFIVAMGIVNLFFSALNVWAASGSLSYGLAVLSFGAFLFAMYVGNDHE